jgi:hypothetical protein
MTSRRTFLAGAGLAAASAPLPWFLARAFAQDPCCGPAERAAAVGSGYRRARAAGKPLLVLVVPPDTATDAYERAHAFGEWLNHGNDEALALLSLVEVVAARVEDVRTVVPSVPVDRSPLMILVDTTDGSHEALDVALPPLFTNGPMGNDAAIDDRIRALTDTLRTGLVPDAARVARLVSRINPRSSDRSAEVYQRALSSRQRSTLMHALAENARARFVRAPIPGSRWAQSWGCGTTIEGDPNPIAVDCGMGHVPERSVRFLHFYVGT